MEPDTSENIYICNNYKILSRNDVRNIFFAFHVTAFIFAALVSLANGTFLFIFITKSKKRRSMKTFYALLSFSDFLYGLFVAVTISVFLNKTFDKLCHVQDAMDSIGFAFCTMSLCAIAAILVEIYLAIMKPLTHATRRDKNTISKILASSWIVCIPLPIICKHYVPQFWDVYSILSWVFIILLLCFIVFVQTTVYLYVKRNPHVRSRDKHAVVTTVIFTCSFFVSFIPIAVIGIYSKFFRHRAILESYILPWAYLMTGINCLADPIVCVLRTAEWRKIILRKVRRTSNTVESTM
ncbi:mas-related G-protein coupled receptor member B8-like [Hydractinia symbiolongicarpus]|uniref:mas-related G-protein coupled receptor member B8-like n=1 Tax=Hydractinia symbiolongicarpus TaxID=13093 RepID=UPI00254C682D|nr:mas-related G-protein coupled receptor member B8-like [Hydractinia symbiolongicarpus]